jgi:hypothetical protein
MQPSELCSQTLEELQNLLINQDQDENGVTGNTLVTNDCKLLVEADVMDARDDEGQKSLCGNSCYGAVNAKYKTLLDNNCFASDDADEEASAKLQAASYQIACQTNADGKYCSMGSLQLGTSLPFLTLPLVPFSPHAGRAGRRGRHVLLALQRHRVGPRLLLPELPPVHVAGHSGQRPGHG